MKRLGLILFCAALVLSFTQCALAAKSAVMIIASKDFQDDEFAMPKKVLEDNGIKVTVASSSLNEATGMNGAKVRPDILTKDIDINSFDAVLLIGGAGATEYLDDAVTQ